MHSTTEKISTRAVEYLIAKGRASAPFTTGGHTVSRIVPWKGSFALVSTDGTGWRLMGRQRSMAVPRGARLRSKSEAQQMLESSSPASRAAHQARAEKLAAAGQGGDTEVVHVTPGEIVVPPTLQSPEVMAVLRRTARAKSVDMRHFTVGQGRINPKTGQEQFDDFCP